jgi:hypothetical protein
MDPKILKEKKKSLYFFQCFLDFLCPFKKKVNICLSNFIHMFTCNSYKYKYFLFHLNMLRLFQKINIFFFFKIKLVSNKKKSFKYIIQRFNPHLFS